MEDKLFRLELARTGTFGADGNSITLKDLQDIVDTFDGKSPISLGHYMTKTSDWWPSFGNVNNIMLEKKEDGENATLIGDISIRSELADAIKSGFYPGWSVSIPPRASDGKRYLHHLAFLGSVPPAIRDLKILGDGENGIAVDMEKDGDAYSDSAKAFYNFADDLEMVAIDDQEEPPGEDKEEETPPQEEEEKPAATRKKGRNSDFSDPIVEKAKTVIKGSIRDRVKSRIEDMIPPSDMQKVDDFCDLCLEGYDFSDTDGEPAVIKLFMEIVDSMKKLPAKPQTGRADFGDFRDKSPDGAIDLGAMTSKF